MKKIPKLKNKKLENIDPDSLTAALHWDKITPDASLRDNESFKANPDIKTMISEELGGAEKIAELKSP